MNSTNLRGPVRREQITPAHVTVTSPKSRAHLLYEDGELNLAQINSLEGGKLFPAADSGLVDPYAPDDVTNDMPPIDGKIASGGHADDARALLNVAGTHWRKHFVRSGEVLAVTWAYLMPRKTRCWTYWITRPDWNAGRQLARDQFEQEPVHIGLNEYRPYWGHEAERALVPRSDVCHKLHLPERVGYHVLLAVQDIADTGKAFYNVIDLLFE